MKSCVTHQALDLFRLGASHRNSSIDMVFYLKLERYSKLSSAQSCQARFEDFFVSGFPAGLLPGMKKAYS